MAELPLAPFKRLMKEAGIERVADDAAGALRDEIESQAMELAERARDYAQHAGRKTIQREDCAAACRRR